MKNVSQFDWEEVRDALHSYAEHLRETEPHATNTIAVFEQAADECPMQDDFE